MIYIRPITEDDTPNVVRWRNNPAVLANFVYQTPFTEEIHINWLKTQVSTGKVHQFIIVEKETEKSVGSVYLRDVDYTHKKAEFGIFIGEDFARGKKYGEIAAKEILRYAFETLELNKVFLRVFSDNKAAISCYHKAGFVREGVFEQDVIINGTPRDMVFMAILKAQWEEDNID